MVELESENERVNAACTAIKTQVNELQEVITQLTNLCEIYCSQIKRMEHVFQQYVLPQHVQNQIQQGLEIQEDLIEQACLQVAQLPLTNPKPVQDPQEEPNNPQNLQQEDPMITTVTYPSSQIAAKKKYQT